MQGTGRWGRNLVRALTKTEGIVVDWIVDPDSEARRTATSIAPKARTAANVAETGFDFDAAVVATPALDHVPHVQSLLVHDKHVLVEKPAAMRRADAEAMTHHATARGLVLMAGHQLCFHPVFARLEQAVREGLIGTVRHVRSVRTGPVDFTKEPGVLWSYGPHDASMLLTLYQDVPRRSEVSILRSTNGVPLEAELRLTFETDGDAEIYLCGLPDKKERRLTVRGDRGILEFDDAIPGGRLLYTDETGTARPIEVPASPDALLLECIHFAECIRTDARPRTGGSHLTDVTRIVRMWMD